jgi:hypothetical protein
MTRNSDIPVLGILFLLVVVLALFTPGTGPIPHKDAVIIRDFVCFTTTGYPQRPIAPYNVKSVPLCLPSHGAETSDADVERIISEIRVPAWGLPKGYDPAREAEELGPLVIPPSPVFDDFVITRDGDPPECLLSKPDQSAEQEHSCRPH